ncbi:MAG: cbb3-type cytochrome c oxidase subunit I [bacterium]
MRINAPGFLAPLNKKAESSLLTYLLQWGGTTDAKRIGIMYMVFAAFMGMVGTFLSLLIRAELATPGLDLMTDDFYITLPGMHATAMIFFFIIPMFTGVGNFILPIQVGAADMAFPRLNLAAFWLLPPAAAIAFAGYFLTGAPQFGWTGYPPLSNNVYSPQIGADFWLLGLVLVGTSSTMGAVNFLSTAFNMRCKGMTLFQIPLFTWSVIVMSFLILASTPVLTSALIMLNLERLFPETFYFYDPAGGGDPILYQHLFWFYSHPAVYIMILPGFGIISEVLPTFSRKPIFGYVVMVWSMIAIAFLGFVVWAHHMFTSGIGLGVRKVFMFLTMLIAVPTGIKIFSWLGTIWGGSIRFTTSMLFALGFLAMFTIGGLSGVVLAAVPVDIQLHDTYYVVAHIHYVLVAGSVMTIFAGLYYWYPKMTGKMLNEKLGHIHFWGTSIFINVTFFIQHYLGVKGMPRRYADYDPIFATENMISALARSLCSPSNSRVHLQLLLLTASSVARWLRRTPGLTVTRWSGRSTASRPSSVPPSACVDFCNRSQSRARRRTPPGTRRVTINLRAHA